MVALELRVLAAPSCTRTLHRAVPGHSTSCPARPSLLQGWGCLGKPPKLGGALCFAVPGMSLVLPSPKARGRADGGHFACGVGVGVRGLLGMGQLGERGTVLGAGSCRDSSPGWGRPGLALLSVRAPGRALLPAPACGKRVGTAAPVR